MAHQNRHNVAIVKEERRIANVVKEKIPFLANQSVVTQTKLYPSLLTTLKGTASQFVYNSDASSNECPEYKAQSSNLVTYE